MRESSYSIKRKFHTPNDFRGGEKKVMKKGLSLLLAASLAFSAFSSAALAADLTAEEKYNALVEAGIFEGFPDGQAHLDQNMTRAQAAKIVALVLGLDQNAAAASIYTDLAEAEWAAGFIGAATALGVLEGRGNGIFDPSANVTIQELAKIMVEALDIEVDPSATVEGADEWAAQYVAAAVGAGLIPAQSDYTVPASRELLVEASFAAYEQVKEEEVANVSLSAVGAKKLEVKFGAAVDPSKAEFSVKKGSIQSNVAKVTFADDNKSAVLELATKLTKGEYTVTVNGVAAEALTASVSVEDEKVAKIEFPSDKAPIDENDPKKISVGIKVSNQYGEDITSGTSLTLTAGKGTATKNGSKVEITASTDFLLNEQVALSAVHTSGAFATVVLTVSPIAKAAEVEVVKLYNEDDKTLVAGSTSDAFYLVVKAKDQYGNPVTGADLRDDVVVTASNPSVANIDRVNNSNANSDANFTTKPIDGTNETVLALRPTGGTTQDQFTAGTSTIFFISKTTGNRTSFDVVVKEQSKVDTLTISVPSVVVAGEKNQLEYTAIDQFGNEMTKESDLEAAGAMLSALNSSLGTIGFEQDYVSGKAKLYLDLTGVTVAEGSTQIAFITGVTGTGKNSVQQSITVQPNAKGVVIGGIKDFTTNFVKGASGDFKAGNIKILDQYGRDYSATYGASNYRVIVKTSDAGKVALDGATFTTGGDTVYGIDSSSDVVKFTAKAKGSSTITLELQHNGTTVENSAYTFSSRVVDFGDIASYEVEDIPTLYASADSKYHKSVKVNGLLSGDVKVALPNGSYTVTSEVYDASTGKLNGSLVSGDLAGDTTEVKKSLVVTIDAANAGAPIVKELTISDKTPVVQSLTLRDSAKVTVGGTDYTVKKEGDLVISLPAALVSSSTDATVRNNLRDAGNAIVKAVDQYGVELTNPGFTNASDKLIITAGTSGKKNDFDAGDTFNLTLIGQDSKVINLKVIVK